MDRHRPVTSGDIYNPPCAMLSSFCSFSLCLAFLKYKDLRGP